MSRIVWTLVILLLVPSGPALCANSITGDEFVRWVAAQHPDIQEALMQRFPESQGYIVLGPLDVAARGSGGHRLKGIAKAEVDRRTASDIVEPAGPFRLICTSDSLFAATVAVLSDTLGIGRDYSEFESEDDVPQFEFEFTARACLLRLYDNSTLRTSLWKMRVRALPDFDKYAAALAPYAARIDEALHVSTTGEGEEAVPAANSFGLPETYDFYAPPPDYVIQGYQNYRDFMREYAGMNTDFAHGIYEIVPSDSLLHALMVHAPRVAHLNKEAPRLQSELKEFFERGGSLTSLSSLTTVGFDTLEAGEYFYAVSLSGRIRFGRERTREEIDRIEKETGRKVPRANHSFLFPGEPVLTAGEFFLEIRDGRPAIVTVDAGSGHYFYSNISPSIREDISERSNEYVLTIGHFFQALDRIHVPYRGAAIRKY